MWLAIKRTTFNLILVANLPVQCIKLKIYHQQHFITVQYGSLSASMQYLCAYSYSGWFEESFLYASNSAWNCIFLNQKKFVTQQKVYICFKISFVFGNTSFKNQWYTLWHKYKFFAFYRVSSYENISRRTYRYIIVFTYECLILCHYNLIKLLR